MVKFILTVPDTMRATVLAQAVRWRETGDVGIRITDHPDRPVSCSVPVHADDVTGATEPSVAGPGASVTDAAQDADVDLIIRDDRSRVVYHVIDTAQHLGPVPQSIRVFLLQHPQSTAHQIGHALGRGRKSVESAIHYMRTRGVVQESERTHGV